MDPPPESPRLGCWSKLFIVLILGVAAIAVTLSLWLRSTADLDAERARAVALGVEMDWEKLGVNGDREHQREILRTITKIGERAKECDVYFFDWERDPWRAASPSGLAGWNSGIDDELDAAISQLDGLPAMQIDPRRIEAALRDRDANRFFAELHNWQQYDISNSVEVLVLRSLRGTGDMSTIAEGLARLAASGAHLSSPWLSFRASRNFVNHVLRHRDAMPTQATASLARQLATSLKTQTQTLALCAPAFWEAALRLPNESMLRAWNVRLPELMQYSIGRDFFQRAGRRAVLARAIDAAAWVGAHGLPETPAEIEAMSPSWPSMTPWRAVVELYGATVDEGACSKCAGRQVSSLHFIVNFSMRLRVQLLLLAANLESGPWPIDPCDPTGGPVRPIIRDGVIIGAYAFGEDMRDDGGTIRTDWCFPLYAQLGKPHAADPPKDP